jgi:hypothetical protein
MEIFYFLILSLFGVSGQTASDGTTEIQKPGHIAAQTNINRPGHVSRPGHIIDPPEDPLPVGRPGH